MGFTPTDSSNAEGPGRVSAPSTLAVLNTAGNSSKSEKTNQAGNQPTFRYVQFLATGKAAENAAKRTDVRDLVSNQLEIAKEAGETDQTGDSDVVGENVADAPNVDEASE